ncbi:hypothetical protein O6H91_15G032200 [Diphasiastrum complanatum]|uniref:Uncharacterized protein n=1 Tax=Diphasiastrum complanatum TaxID=34168 RepID=A0ACC2BH58_DIPCM|nr:hypothetical protein O6H91_15G032200 [Diphasiastrum complanatum]
MQLPCSQIPFEFYAVALKPCNVKSVDCHKFSNRCIVAKQSCVSFNSPSICKKTSIGLAMSYFRSRPQYTHSALKYLISSVCSRPEQSLPCTSRLNVNILPDSASSLLLRRFNTNSVQDFKAFNRSGASFGKRAKTSEKVGTPLEARAKNTSELIRGESVVSAGGALGCSLISSLPPGCASSTEVGSAAVAEVMFKGEINEANGLKQTQALTAVETALGTPFSNSPQVPPPKPLVIVISGPSGVGKDAVIKRLQEVRREFHFVVTATTRSKRPGEVDGIDYYFVTKEEFRKLIDDKELLEFALVYGDYKGIPKQQVTINLPSDICFMRPGA